MLPVWLTILGLLARCSHVRRDARPRGLRLFIGLAGPRHEHGGGVRILPPRNLAPLVYPSQVTPALAHVAQPQREFRRKPKRAPTTFASSRLMARAFVLSRAKPAGHTQVAVTHRIAKSARYSACKPLSSRQMQTSESR